MVGSWDRNVPDLRCGAHDSKALCGFGMLTKWFSLTRLETRTKESNVYASIWVENPDA